MIRTAAVIACLANPAFAQDEAEAFVDANLLGIFYHELGHALIDVLQLPVFGQEEDAADTASIMLIDALYENEAAIELAYDAALGFYAESLLAEQEGWDVTYWDVHGPNEQRFYNTVCLFYGGDPDSRDGFAEDMELPEDRSETCAEEYDLAAGSWGAVFDDISAQGGASLIYSGDPDASVTDYLMSIEVQELNSLFSLPQDVEVVVESCGEANAFYDPQLIRITMCIEFEEHLLALYDMIHSGQ